MSYLGTVVLQPYLINQACLLEHPASSLVAPASLLTEDILKSGTQRRYFIPSTSKRKESLLKPEMVAVGPLKQTIPYKDGPMRSTGYFAKIFDGTFRTRVRVN
jgi:hypothetical protein